MVGRELLSSLTLSPTESEAVRTFLEQSTAKFPTRVLEVILFGSAARGESAIDSDIDLLVILDSDDPALRRSILQLGARVSLEHDVLLGILAMSEQKWKAHQGFFLYNNIAQEGIAVL